ncbi:6-pyruvoyltetrahydropterin synthase [Flavobacteriaceae bacterium UJ101]|nr:6-pyruvoyltetrahydropterin synthase [Flavobacteriaceae bacterium UJ101]
MKNIRLTKIFNFESGHALYGYDGKCKNLHGHSYKLYVTILGTPIEDQTNPKFGMVYDFGDLKKIVNQEIIDPFDHAIVLNQKTPHLNLGNHLSQEGHKIIFTDYQPTCENMLLDFASKIQNKLPATIKLHSLRLYETENSYGEWFAEDNQ